MDSISLKAPATIANLSCGFDILGLCIQNPYDEITITKNITSNVSHNSIYNEYHRI